MDLVKHIKPQLKFETETRAATLSACGKYRYLLSRCWDVGLPMMVFVMQNPSTADALDDDPTIRRCISFAAREGMGSIYVKNVFALRATDEKELLKVEDPVGPDNNAGWSVMGSLPEGSKLVVAWGERTGGKKLAAQYDLVAAQIAPFNPFCLGTNKSGEPKHPLYLAAKTPLVPWKPRTA